MIFIFPMLMSPLNHKTGCHVEVKHLPAMLKDVRCADRFDLTNIWKLFGRDTSESVVLVC